MSLTFKDESRSQKSEAFGFTSEREIYGAIFPQVASFDVTSSLLNVPNGSTIENVTAVAGYFKNDNAQAPSNAVGLFGCGMVTQNNGAGWGINTLLQDSAVRAAGTGTGRVLLGAELDFNVMNPGTQVIGVSVGGNSLAQPANASAFIANTLSETYHYKWTTAFYAMDGCAENAIAVGPGARFGVNVPSQKVLLQYFDATGAKQTLTLQAESGLWNFKTGGLNLGAGNITLQTGYSLIVNGQPVVGSRKVGWTPGTGTPNRGVFDADYTQTISGTYSATQVQILQDQLLSLQRRVLALESDLRAHGLIGA